MILSILAAATIGFAAVLVIALVLYLGEKHG